MRVFRVLPAAALLLMLIAPVKAMRADTVFSNFGGAQTYVGNAWWNLGGTTTSVQQVDAFSFVPSETATVTGADLALTLFTGTATPINVYIESSAGGTPGSILGTLTQTGSYSAYPTTSVVSFLCTATCPTLDAGTTYWIVGQQPVLGNTDGWLYSFNDTGTWYYNDANSATGPWTTATAGDTFSAFDVTGTPASTTSLLPEPGSLTLLGSGMLGVIAAARRRVRRG